MKFVLCNGYKINDLKGYNFNREFNVFTKYVNKISSADYVYVTQKYVAKSLLNNLLSIFDISLDKSLTKMVNIETYKRYCV